MNKNTILDKSVLLEIMEYIGIHTDAKVKMNNLISSLHDFTYLSSNKTIIPTGSYVRYIKKCFVENELKIGGYVSHSNTYYVHISREGLNWKIRKDDYFIFFVNGLRDDCIPKPLRTQRKEASEKSKALNIKRKSRTKSSTAGDESNKDGNFKKAAIDNIIKTNDSVKFPAVKDGVYQPIEKFLKKI